MHKILKKGQPLLFMKVGCHAQESLEDIVARKSKEIRDAGFALWGYGGNTCHPETVVQPFAKTYERQGHVIYLCMHPMASKHFAQPVRADEYSIDGYEWHTIDPNVHVLGSRYALVIKNLRADDFELPLSKTKVVLGRCAGLDGRRYISGRVDKACLEVAEDVLEEPREDSLTHIGLVADLAEPYAVYVRNRL